MYEICHSFNDYKYDYDDDDDDKDGTWHGQDPILHQGHGRQASPRAPINTGPAIIDENWDDVWSTMISVDAMMIMNVVIVVVMVMAMMMIMGT